MPGRPPRSADPRRDRQRHGPFGTGTARKLFVDVVWGCTVSQCLFIQGFICSLMHKAFHQIIIFVHFRNDILLILKLFLVFSNHYPPDSYLFYLNIAYNVLRKGKSHLIKPV